MKLTASLLRGATTENLLRLAARLRVTVGDPWTDAGRAELIARIVREAQLVGIRDRFLNRRAT